jgi:putative two-component system response regulator
MENRKRKIIVADDSPTMVAIISNLLAKHGYSIFNASDGYEAISLVNKLHPDLIILDIMMPVISGLEVCRTLKSDESTKFIPVIILTASDSRDDKNKAISVGANDYLNKPYDKTELMLKVESLLKLKSAVDELESTGNIILALTKAVEAKDRYTEGHAERVSLFASKIAKKMNLSDEQTRNVITAAMLHDIGKIGIPDGILNKTESLSSIEFDLIKQHTIIGEEICSPIKSFENIKGIVRHHHEKLNGTGYPDGLSGDSIDIETRIVSVSDIYDALTSTRQYHTALDEESAFKILDTLVAKYELDNRVVEVFKNVILG